MRLLTILTTTLILLSNDLCAAPLMNQGSENRSLNLISSSPAHVSLRSDLKGVATGTRLVNGELRSTTTLPGEPSTSIPGMPELPAVSRFVVVSPTSNLALEIISEPPRREAATYPPQLYSPEEGVFVDAGTVGDVFPDVLAEMGEPFIIRGVRMVKVTTYPVRFDKKTNEYLFYDNIDVAIKAVEGEAVNAVVERRVGGYNPDFQQYIGDFAVNGSDVSRDDPDRDTAPANEGKYLIVCPEACVEWIQPFIEFRRQVGYQVEILALSNDQATNSGVVLNSILNLYNRDLNAGREPFGYLLLVGDYTDYQTGPDAENVLASPSGNQAWGQPDHADYLYACLEGDDDRPDIAWARWPGGSEEVLGLIIGRQLAVSAHPPVGNPELFTRAAIYSQHYGNCDQCEWVVGLQTNVRWGEEVMQRQFDDVRFYENFQWDQFGEEMGPFLDERLNEGLGIIAGRAENYYYASRNPQQHDFLNSINDNTYFPVNICLGNQNQWGAEAMFRQGSADHMKGMLATTLGYGYNMIGMQNAMWMEMVNCVVNKDMPLGWAWNYASNVVERYFPANLNFNARPAFSMHRADASLWGDPAFKPWIGVPRRVTLTHTETITPATRMVEATVLNEENQTPVTNAIVTLYAPGEIPLDDAEEYTDYDQILQIVARSDAEGKVSFLLPEGESFVNETTVYITASGRDIAPCFEEVSVSVPAASIEISRWWLTETDGNGDDLVNPGERFDLHVAVQNSGTGEQVNGLTGSVTSRSPYVQIDDEDGFRFGDIAVGEEVEADQVIPLIIAANCPDAAARPLTAPELVFEFQNNEIWRSAIRLDPHAPHLEVLGIPSGSIVPDSASLLNLEIINRGRASSPAVNARLFTLGIGVTVVTADSRFPAIAAGASAELAGEPFVISGNTIVPPGAKNRMRLVLTNENAILDSSEFELQIMRPRDNAPFGPDSYGYICFDNTDQDWDIAPNYDWIELNPIEQNVRYEGISIQFDENDEQNIGAAEVIQLGFETTFYGETFDAITVSTNGTILMGEQPRISNHQRWPMDRAIGGGAGMIAPYWNDLFWTRTSRVFYYHDELHGRMIIEWHRMGFVNADGEATFQTILFDKRFWMTESGDQDILFQYKTISNQPNLRGGENEWISGNPYASVGISSPDGLAGISYTFNGVYPTGAAPLANHRAIKFATTPDFSYCILYGNVSDAETNEPIEGATVRTGYFRGVQTDAEGNWRIGNAIADEHFPIIVSKQGYLDSLNFDMEPVGEGDSLEINFRLLHPELALSVGSVDILLDENVEINVPLTITNNGNGALRWRTEKRLIAEQQFDLWQQRIGYAVGDSVEDDRIEGVVFANDNFYLSGANGADSNMIYVLDRDLHFVRQFEQVAHSRYGIKDLEWDGELIWGSGEESIFGFNTEGELIRSWQGPFNPNNNIAWDSDNNRFWISGTTSNISSYDVNGNFLAALPRKSLRIYGLAYFPEDPDGYNLYILSYPSDDSPTKIYKMRTLDGDTMLARSIPLNEGGTGIGGLFISNEYDFHSWVLMTTENVPNAAGGDQLNIYQIRERTDWFTLSPAEGNLPPDEHEDLMLGLNTTNLPDTTFVGELRFIHNADSGLAVMSITLTVRGELEPTPFELLSPPDADSIVANFDQQNYVPEMRFGWSQSTDPNEADTLLSYRLNFEGAFQRAPIALRDTFKVIDFDTLNVANWFGREVRWWVDAISDRDTVESTRRFRFTIYGPNGLGDEIDIPIEFGLRSIYPNPFNSKSTITFGVEQSVGTTLRAYDVEGRLVATLYEGVPAVGYHRVSWTADNLPTGVYVVRLESMGEASIRKLTLMK